MPVTFRDGRYHKHVTLGKRRVKEGECCAVWNSGGQYRLVPGPARITVWRSDVRFLERFMADEQQYLVIRFRDGRKEHLQGPSAVFLDPVVHQDIAVHDAILLNAFEAIVVYTGSGSARDTCAVGIPSPAPSKAQSQAAELVTGAPVVGKCTAVTQRTVRGPLRFVPTAHEWVHTFTWHAEDPKDKGHMVRNEQFQKLAPLPDQLYYNVKDVRTADDAQLVVKLMIFYQLDDVETMLDTTQDPLGDFVNAVSADVVRFGARNTFESFLQRTGELSELAAFPVLLDRARQIGYSVNQVVFRGYKASDQLQAMHDAAIKARTQLRLDFETQQQQQHIEDLALAKTAERSTQEEAIQFAAHDAQMRREAAEHAARLQQKKEEFALEEEHARQQDTQRVAYLQRLKVEGVDLTKYLTSQNQRSDKLVRIETDAANAGHTNVHV